MSLRKHWAVISLGIMVLGLSGWLIYAHLDRGSAPEGWGRIQVDVITYGHQGKGYRYIEAKSALAEWLGEHQLSRWEDERHPQEMEIVSITSLGSASVDGKPPYEILVVYRIKNPQGMSWSPADWGPD